MAATHVAADLDDLVVVDACDAPPAIVVYHCGGGGSRQAAAAVNRKPNYRTAPKVRPGIPHYPILE